MKYKITTFYEFSFTKSKYCCTTHSGCLLFAIEIPTWRSRSLIGVHFRWKRAFWIIISPSQPAVCAVRLAFAVEASLWRTALAIFFSDRDGSFSGPVSSVSECVQFEMHLKWISIQNFRIDWHSEIRNFSISGLFFIANHCTQVSTFLNKRALQPRCANWANIGSLA